MKNIPLDQIKICHVTTVDITVRFIILNFLRFLQKENYNVSIVCSPGKWSHLFEKQGFSFHNIKITRKITPVRDLISLIKLFLYFKKEKFTIVHTHTPKPGLLGQLAAKIAGVPIIVNTIHGFYFQKRDSWAKRKFFILVEKIAAKCSDLIFFVNREDMETAIKEKICVSGLSKYFGGGINIFKFNLERFSEQWVYQKKRELNIEPDFKIIGIVGRLVKEKGYLDLFEAFEKIVKQFPKTLLLVIGPEEPKKKDKIDQNIIKNYGIEKNVLFLGQRTDVDELYPLFDIFVLPSYREGFPYSIMEASAAERPIVATNIRGCREAVEDGVTGILVPPKNPNKLAQALIYLLDNPEKSKELGGNGRRKAKKEFDERKIFGRIKTEYQRLIKEKL